MGLNYQTHLLVCMWLEVLFLIYRDKDPLWEEVHLCVPPGTHILTTKEMMLHLTCLHLQNIMVLNNLDRLDNKEHQDGRPLHLTILSHLRAHPGGKIPPRDREILEHIKSKNMKKLVVSRQGIYHFIRNRTLVTRILTMHHSHHIHSHIHTHHIHSLHIHNNTHLHMCHILVIATFLPGQRWAVFKMGFRKQLLYIYKIGSLCGRFWAKMPLYL